MVRRKRNGDGDEAPAVEEQVEGTVFVRLKPGHPSGTYHRSGLTFTQEGRMVAPGEITDAIRTDPWLEIVEDA